jgi:hypothetical protein
VIERDSDLSLGDFLLIFLFWSMKDQGEIMNFLKAIMRLATGPLGAVVIFAGGGAAFAYIYLNTQPPPGASNEKPGGAPKLVQHASAPGRSDPDRGGISTAPTASAPGKSRKPRAVIASSGKKDVRKGTPVDRDDAGALESKDAVEVDEAPERPSTLVAVADAKPPKTQADSNESVELSTPERVLDNRGLTKVGQFYVVATETEIGKQYREITPIFDLVEAAYVEFQAILEVETLVQTLDDQRIVLEARINEIGLELGRITGSRLPEDQVYRTELNTELPLRKEALNNTNRDLRIAVKRLANPARKKAVYDEFFTRRDQFLAASRELQPIVKRATAEYRKLDQDAAVKDALRAVESDTNSNVKLGPSKSLKNAIGRLTRAERWLAIDKSVYRRGTKKKSKAN